MSRTALVRGAAVSVIAGGVLAVGTAPAFAWFTTGPNGETICEFGGTYPDCNTEPTPGTSEGGGGATETPAPSESPSTPVETATPTESPSPGTSEGGGGATGVPSPTTVAVVGGTGTTTTSGAAVSAAQLPFTGFEVGAAAAIGLAALGAGTVFIVGSRRRRGTSTSA
jgi:hypothetical protein